jgi:predicted NUDIX family phosphoesterase
MSARYPNEHVLVVKRTLFDALGSFQGLSFEVGRYLPAFLNPANNFFLSRDDAEHDPSHKQIIPYAIFHHSGRFLRYVRSRKTGEQRLAAKASLGIGGHINTDDAAAASLERGTYLAGVEREIAEELTIQDRWRQRVVALLNDDSNDVGQVHLGVVHLVDLDSDRVAPNEDTISDVKFLSRDELAGERERLETWSQICLDGLGRFLHATVG